MFEGSTPSRDPATWRLVCSLRLRLLFLVVLATLHPGLGRVVVNFKGNSFLHVAPNRKLDLLSSGSLEAWVKISRTQSFGSILSKSENVGGQYLRNYAVHLAYPNANGDLRVEVKWRAQNFVVRWDSDWVVPSDQWTHIAVVFQRTTSDVSALLYVNSRKEDLTYELQPSNALSFPLPRNNGSLLIGYDIGYADLRGFQGQIAEIRIWSLPLPEQQIREFYRQSLEGTETGLVAYWRLDDNKGLFGEDLTTQPQIAAFMSLNSTCRNCTENLPSWSDAGSSFSESDASPGKCSVSSSRRMLQTNSSYISQDMGQTLNQAGGVFISPLALAAHVVTAAARIFRISLPDMRVLESFVAAPALNASEAALHSPIGYGCETAAMSLDGRFLYCGTLPTDGKVTARVLQIVADTSTFHLKSVLNLPAIADGSCTLASSALSSDSTFALFAFICGTPEIVKVDLGRMVVSDLIELRNESRMTDPCNILLVAHNNSFALCGRNSRWLWKFHPSSHASDPGWFPPSRLYVGSATLDVCILSFNSQFAYCALNRYSSESPSIIKIQTSDMTVLARLYLKSSLGYTVAGALVADGEIGYFGTQEGWLIQINMTGMEVMHELLITFGGGSGKMAALAVRRDCKLGDIAVAAASDGWMATVSLVDVAALRDSIPAIVAPLTGRYSRGSILRLLWNYTDPDSLSQFHIVGTLSVFACKVAADNDSANPLCVRLADKQTYYGQLDWEVPSLLDTGHYIVQLEDVASAWKKVIAAIEIVDPGSSSSEGLSHSNMSIMVGSTSGGVSLLLIALFFFGYHRHKRLRMKKVLAMAAMAGATTSKFNDNDTPLSNSTAHAPCWSPSPPPSSRPPASTSTPASAITSDLNVPPDPLLTSPDPLYLPIDMFPHMQKSAQNLSDLAVSPPSSGEAEAGVGMGPLSSASSSSSSSTSSATASSLASLEHHGGTSPPTVHYVSAHTASNLHSVIFVTNQDLDSDSHAPRSLPSPHPTLPIDPVAHNCIIRYDANGNVSTIRPMCAACMKLYQAESMEQAALRICDHCILPIVLHGRYCPLSRLGGGNFGTTFLAMDLHLPSHPRCVVKKFTYSKLDSDFADKAQALFFAEARNLELLNHRCIPKLLASFVLHGDLYHVMEEAVGDNLQKILASRAASFNEAEVRRLLMDLLDALQYLHSKNIIHRDIKPSNIVLCTNGSYVLVDFGISKRMYVDAVVGDVATGTGTHIGTLEFSGPEQWAGRATFASDLYSLAATAVILMMGPNAQPSFDYFQRWEPSIAGKAGVSISPTLGRVLKTMLHPRAECRFGCAQAALGALTVPPPSAASDCIPPSASLPPIHDFGSSVVQASHSQISTSFKQRRSQEPEVHVGASELPSADPLPLSTIPIPDPLPRNSNTPYRERYAKKKSCRTQYS